MRDPLGCALLFYWGLACSGGPPEDHEAPPPSDGLISTLTYNVHGLPPAITGDDTPGRMLAIGPLLNDFQLVALQEDFDDANHASLAELSEHPVERRFHARLLDRAYGSGLSVFSDFEAVDSEGVHYTDCHGLVDSANDCLASKGFQRLRLKLAEGIEVEVYNTHLEAGGSDEDNNARSRQVDQLLAAMNGPSAGRPLIFLGDTNLHGGDPADEPLLERLMTGAGLSDACDAVGCDQPGRIDRILFRSSEDLQLEVLDWDQEEAFVDETGGALSDHDAISAQLRWQR